MFTNEHEAALGIEGYGPERAMYEAILNHTGLHSEQGGRFAFAPPGRQRSVDVWGYLMDSLDGAVDGPVRMMRSTEVTGPPFGMKIGVIPILSRPPSSIAPTMSSFIRTESSNRWSIRHTSNAC